MSHVEESRAGSDGRLVPVPFTRDPQTLLSGRQLTAESGGINKKSPGSAPTSDPGTLAVAHLRGDTPDVPRGAVGVSPRLLCCRGGPCASLATPGQSCSRWQADDNEISNISKMSFSETDLTMLSPTRTLGEANLLFGAGENVGRLCSCR